MNLRNALASLAILLLAFSSSSAQQSHAVQITGISFVDSVTGTNVTNVTVGTPIVWSMNAAMGHTVTSGTTPASPIAGALFNISLTGNASGSYTPMTVGTIPYHCIPHFAFGMTGTINVSGSPTTYPGSGEDFRMLSAVTPFGSLSLTTPTTGAGNEIKSASILDYLTIVFESPSASFNGLPLIALAEPFVTGTPPVGPMGLHVSTTGATILANGLIPNPLGFTTVVAPGGTSFIYQLPVALSGFSVMLQGLAITNSATNGFFALSDAHEIQM